MKLRAFAALAAAFAGPILAPTGGAAEPASMTAVIAADGKLSLQSVPMPTPGSGQVRVKVRAASVNPVDWKLTGRAAAGAKSIPGRDFAGVIDAVGPDVSDWKAGDAVIGLAAGGGAYAQYTLAKALAIARKPKNLSFEEAAGIPVVGETAWRAIVTVADVQPHQHVLIHGGAGGVGSSALQIAKARGAWVAATASASNQDFLKHLGADTAIDYTAGKFEDRIRDLEVVVNTVDADTGLRSIGIVRKGGILVSVVGLPPADQCDAAGIRCAVTGSVTGEMLPKLTGLAEAGQFHINVEQVLPLADAAKAWELSRAGHVRGKIILVPGN